jgi:DNA-binding transcriptional ArsR family regulator
MDEAAQNLDRMFQALADPTRRAIVERLSRGPASVSELALPLPMSLPGVVQHLQVLEQSGLVTTKKVGRTRTCSIDTAALSQVERWLNERRIGWEKRFDRLGAFLDADDGKTG